MKSFVIGIACVLLLVSFVPLARGQEEPPVEQPPLIPPDLAEGISEMSQGPLMSVILAGLAFVVALGVDVIDTIIALGVDGLDTIIALAYTAISTYSLSGLILGLMGSTLFVGYFLGWIKGFARLGLFIVRHLFILGWFIRIWDFIKFLGGPIPII